MGWGRVWCEKGIQVPVNCSDNHKAWQSLEIFLHGCTLELIHLYVKQTGEDPNAMGFFKWQHNIKSATLRMMFDAILTFGLGIYAQRVGDRNNDTSISEAGRFAFLNWFYGFNHPFYQ